MTDSMVQPPLRLWRPSRVRGYRFGDSVVAAEVRGGWITSACLAGRVPTFWTADPEQPRCTDCNAELGQSDGMERCESCMAVREEMAAEDEAREAEEAALQDEAARRRFYSGR